MNEETNEETYMTWWKIEETYMTWGKIEGTCMNEETGQVDQHYPDSSWIEETDAA
jgi:hypothetical protein